MEFVARGKALSDAVGERAAHFMDEQIRKISTC